MDQSDKHIIAALRKDGRASISALAETLNMSRATVRTRLEKLQSSGVIVGFGVILKEDTLHMPVRGHMLIEILGQGTEKVIRQLSGLTAVEAIHSTNGKWDLIVELAAEDLEQFDHVLREIRLIQGIATSETNLLLATRKMTRQIQR